MIRLPIFLLLLVSLGACSFSDLQFWKKREAHLENGQEKAPIVAVSATIAPTPTPAPPPLSTEVPKEKELPKLTAQVIEYCKKIDHKFKKFNWGKSRCREFPWHHVRNSVLGDPLIWVSYGDEQEHKKNDKDTTMILCGVHGDEITPIKFCFDIMFSLEKNIDQYKDKMIVIAPIVNPDSFFRRNPTRTNQRKVDINRNFPTKDWDRDALRLWKRRYRSDKRRYPGKKAMSEPEVVFQVNLIKRYQPDKIISVHAPLTMWDYDGPEDETTRRKQFLALREVRAKQLLKEMSHKAKGYRIKNYPHFPGSLGNWAGNERNIPTYTLELPSSDYTKTKEYWKLFEGAIHSAFVQVINKKEEEVAMEKADSESAKTP